MKQWFQNRHEKFIDWFNELDSENQANFMVAFILLITIVIAVSINIMILEG